MVEGGRRRGRGGEGPLKRGFTVLSPNDQKKISSLFQGAILMGSRKKLCNTIGAGEGMENPDLPLFPSEGPFKIKERVKFPGLYFAYIVGVLQPERVDGPPYKDTSGEKERMVQTYGSRLRDTQFIYPEPEDLGAKHGKCACAWFADRGEWMYALEQTQRNAYLPQAFPTWLRTLSRQLQTASKKTRFVGNGFNCCLISYGISSSWTYGEDPWHRLNGQSTE